MALYYGHKTHTNMLSTPIASFQKVAENTELGKKDLRVFIFLCCRLESKFYKRIDKKQIAETLDISKDDVEKCLKNLMTQKIIEQGGDEHVKKGYRFSYADKEGNGKFSTEIIMD